jgi:hypothetical protein
MILGGTSAVALVEIKMRYQWHWFELKPFFTSILTWECVDSYTYPNTYLIFDGKKAENSGNGRGRVDKMGTPYKKLNFKSK